MKALENFPKLKQEKETSCWACASRMIINYYEKKVVYSTDMELAEAYASEKKNESYKNFNKAASALDVLSVLKYQNYMDSNPLPKIIEIREKINNDRPLLALVSQKKLKAFGKPEPERNNDSTSHWVVIIGYNNNQILIADPANKEPRWVNYDKEEYQGGYTEKYYWISTSYVDSKSEK
jgi:ABC-type bacteriocin/lantibiotic exporter with double-glycine peptidase domain